jgi:hypothetical protein
LLLGKANERMGLRIKRRSYLIKCGKRWGFESAFEVAYVSSMKIASVGKLLLSELFERSKLAKDATERSVEGLVPCHE